MKKGRRVPTIHQKKIFRLSRIVLHFDIEQNRHITGLRTFSLFSVDAFSEVGLNHWSRCIRSTNY